MSEIRGQRSEIENYGKTKAQWHEQKGGTEESLRTSFHDVLLKT